jgi:alanine or glycine:cation symporter, AGCS family
MQSVETALKAISDFVWGPPLLILLFGTHIYLTIRLKFMQRYIFKAIKLSFSRSEGGVGDISNFGALVTALAATIGTGNIIGVSAAIAAGGPGAVFWMWLTGVFGIPTKFAEAVLSIKYRIVAPDGSMAGGPMYVLERGMGIRWLGIVFAVFTAVAAFGIGNMVQANSAALMLKETLHISPWLSGAAMTIFTACVILGGIKSIAKTCEVLVPVMAISYILGCLIILCSRYETIPGTISLIVTSAFTGQAAVGGFLGAGMKEAIRYGIARGLFSNESGLGSAPIVAAAAQTKEPVHQGLISSTGTFWDTVVVCALTGLTIVNSGGWQKGLNNVELVRYAFAVIPVFGPAFLTFGLFTFVFSTILGWSYYGEEAIEYLFGLKAVWPYRYVWVVCVMIGSVASLELVWTFADITNALMAVPNLISLIVLTPVVISETKKYLK